MRRTESSSTAALARMKVLILGGYGVFGGRLARLLLQDGIEVIVAGRNFERAAAFTRQYGGTPLFIDIARDLSPIANAAPGLAADAAGPFQSYGSDPYRVARFCIDHAIHYLDLSDDAAFTAGIAALNERALAARCFALSGVSSVPAISASAVRLLSEDLSEIQLIETALVPGNRAPRGRSVIGSILSQAGGAAYDLARWGLAAAPWLDGSETSFFGPGFKRWASLIGAPELQLFPKAFNARSVVFRAGLELGVMHWGVAFLARLRALGLVPNLTVFLGPILWMSERLKPFGSDRGAMAVDVTRPQGWQVDKAALASDRQCWRRSFYPRRSRPRHCPQIEGRRSRRAAVPFRSLAARNRKRDGRRVSSSSPPRRKRRRRPILP